MLFISLLAFVSIALSLPGNGVNAACCLCPITGACKDGARCTPNCGYGKCNLFGCACNGGCRHSKKSESRAFVAKSLGVDVESSDLFAIADKNGDGKMTFVEWRDSPVRSTSNGETSASLAEIWAKYDTENVGYLTEDEATNRKA